MQKSYLELIQLTQLLLLNQIPEKIFEKKLKLNPKIEKSPKEEAIPVKVEEKIIPKEMESLPKTISTLPPKKKDWIGCEEMLTFLKKYCPQVTLIHEYSPHKVLFLFENEIEEGIFKKIGEALNKKNTPYEIIHINEWQKFKGPIEAIIASKTLIMSHPFLHPFIKRETESQLLKLNNHLLIIINDLTKFEENPQFKKEWWTRLLEILKI